VPTVTFGVLYVFFVLSLERRRVIHVNVTEHPTAEWAAQQIVEAVGPDVGLARLIRDRDKIFGAAFDRRVENLGLTQLRIAPRSMAERVRRTMGGHCASGDRRPRDRARRAPAASDPPRVRCVLAAIDGSCRRDAEARRAPSSPQEGRGVNAISASTTDRLDEHRSIIAGSGR
jgi:hypothetical protein